MPTDVPSGDRAAPFQGRDAAPKPYLSVRGLRVEAPLEKSSPALVEDASFELGLGEMVGLVGDSGSGKTLTALAVMDLLPRGLEQMAGEVQVAGAEGSLAMIFQEPRSALNPILTVGFQIAESLRLRGLRGAEVRRRGVELLRQVALPDAAERWRAYPHQLSGGQCQRVMLAMALAAEPKILIADEPTTALDVSVQAQVLELLGRTRRQLGLGVLLITHDLAVVAATCDRLLVMEKGRIVEGGTVREVFANPAAEATRRLLAASRSMPVESVA